MIKVKTASRFLVAIVALPLSIGCVAGQKVGVTYAPEVAASVADLGSVTATVVDERDFIVNGEKDPSYIGHFRGGFGNPWNVKTEGEVALAELVQKDLMADLKALGFSVVAEGATRTLQVKIKDWNFDSYTNVKLWYDLAVTVRDDKGEILAESTLKEDNIVIQGSVMTGPKKAFKREYPKIYTSIIKKIVRENEPVLAALKD